jgi:putative FmdB family regulatory protein
LPRYDYVCAACSRRFEVVHGIHEDGPTSCPLCGEGPVRKAFAAPAIHFKGSGWAKKERRAAKAPSSGSDGGAGDGDGSAAATGSSTDEGGSTPAKDTGKDAGKATARDAAATTTSAPGD